MKKIIPMLALALISTSCKQKKSPPPTAEDLLLGGHSCVNSMDCPTGICRFGMCTGLLTVPRLLDRLFIWKHVKKICAKHTDLRAQMIRNAGLLMKSKQTDPVIQGRAAQTIGMFCEGQGCGGLLDCVQHDKDPLKFYCITGLALSGWKQAGKLLQRYKDFPDPVKSIARFMEAQAWKDL